ncbi:MAG: TetR/AcrR family transcriptional regulator [Myxococcota bacterium]|nr:TetR/AcrR family transcriptional regulator [Myxococcota bacterium]
MSAAQPRRRTQAERSASTQARLVEATIGCLVELGYAGTTTVAVCRRAGVSHGSLLHHFGTRERLLGAALEAVYARLRGRVVAGLEELPHGDARVDALVTLMWSAFGAPEFKAVLELWVAAANQPELSWAVWPEARAFDAGSQPLAEQLFPEVAARLPDFPVYVSLIFQVLQGMGLAQATLPVEQADREMRERVRRLLEQIVREAFAGASA